MIARVARFCQIIVYYWESIEVWYKNKIAIGSFLDPQEKLQEKMYQRRFELAFK